MGLPLGVMHCNKFFLGFVTIQLNPMVESHGLHKVVMPKKGTESSSIAVFNILSFVLLIAIDNQFIAVIFHNNLYKQSLFIAKSLFDAHI